MKTSFRNPFWIAFPLLLCACNKGSTSTQAGLSASAQEASAASALSPTSSTSSNAAALETWTGTYKAKVGAVTPPKEAKVSVWASDSGKEAVGDGTLTLTIADPTHTVTGEGKGPLGDLVLHGEWDGKELRARVDPKDPNAESAMTGVFSATLNGAKLEGTLRVSGKNANRVREAEVKMTKGS